jgi:hypothetical protein
VAGGLSGHAVARNPIHWQQATPRVSGISNIILWGIIDIHADALKAAVEAMLAKHDAE